jgi:hypothetical protein
LCLGEGDRHGAQAHPGPFTCLPVGCMRGGRSSMSRGTGALRFGVGWRDSGCVRPGAAVLAGELGWVVVGGGDAAVCGSGGVCGARGFGLVSNANDPSLARRVG